MRKDGDDALPLYSKSQELGPLASPKDIEMSRSSSTTSHRTTSAQSRVGFAVAIKTCYRANGD